MKKGQRLSLPVVEQRLKYIDAYTLDLPLLPPSEVRGNLTLEQQMEMARLFGAPKPAHVVRLTNSTTTPLTTAPAVILRDEHILSQGTMTYAAPGATVDLEVGKAVDIQVKRTETEVSRIPNTLRLSGDPPYSEVRLSGTIRLTNYKKEAAQLEVPRQVLGAATTAGSNGRIEKLDALRSTLHGGDITTGPIGGTR